MSDVYYRNAFNRDRLVHIVDSDMSDCEALSVLFRLEGFQTAFSGRLADMLAAVDRRAADVLIMKFRVGGENTLPTLTRVKAMRAGTQIFMIADDPDVTGAVEAMKAGAADVFTKPIDTESLVRAVRDGLRRDVHIGAVQGGRRPVEIRGFSQLTPRERQVLQLVTNGQSNKEAGRELGISPRTIEVHRARVMEKLGARNTADLVRIVLTS
ncbi:MAG TPA: LuxR C-terminal-related transcriptional regulator [Devosiaceae bacterium]|nr:LuxR C-terminal-related transcriptional regulator [Devosiaceae bacterium]